MSIDAIKNMSANEDVVTRSLIMLTNVCFNNDLNRIIAKKLGAVEAIVIGELNIFKIQSWRAKTFFAQIY